MTAAEKKRASEARASKVKFRASEMSKAAIDAQIESLRADRARWVAIRDAATAEIERITEEIAVSGDASILHMETKLREQGRL